MNIENIWIFTKEDSESTGHRFFIGSKEEAEKYNRWLNECAAKDVYKEYEEEILKFEELIQHYENKLLRLKDIQIDSIVNDIERKISCHKKNILWSKEMQKQPVHDVWFFDNMSKEYKYYITYASDSYSEKDSVETYGL